MYGINRIENYFFFVILLFSCTKSSLSEYIKTFSPLLKNVNSFFLFASFLRLLNFLAFDFFSDDVVHTVAGKSHLRWKGKEYRCLMNP